MKWIQVRKDHPLVYFFCYSLNTLKIGKKLISKGNQKACRPPDLGKVPLFQLHAGPRKINKNKLADLIELLPFVPPIHHSFYHQLASCDEVLSSEEEMDSEETE